jgi:Ca-activated chloride channel family protein
MASHDVLAPLWARARVESMLSEDYEGAQTGNIRADLKETITQLGIEYRLMTQYTSFVAVEEMIVTDGDQPRRIDVPVEVPEGVNGLVSFDDSTSTYYKTRPSSAGNFAYGAGQAKSLRVSSGVLNSRAPIPAPPNAPPTVTVTVSPAEPPSRIGSGVADAERRDESRQKLHRSILTVVERLRKKEALSSADEAGFIRNGKAEVQVWLTDKSDETRLKLKELGFEVVLDPKTTKLLIGRIPIDKLEALAALKFVSYVSPQLSK